MTIDMPRMKETALLLAQLAIDNFAVSTGKEPPRFVEFRDRIDSGEVLLVSHTVLGDTLDWAKRDIEGKSEKDNPYWSQSLEDRAIGFHQGLIMAHQIMTGVRK